MKLWTADITNDPDNDYELMVEIFYDNQEIGTIKKKDVSLELIIYPRENSIVIPLDWLCKIISEVYITKK